MQISDIPALAALLLANTEWVGRYKNGPPDSRQAVLRLLAMEMAAHMNARHWYAVVLVDSRIVGQVALKPMSATDVRTEFIIWLSEESSGQGVGKSALSQLCDVAFTQRGLVILHGRIARANLSSLAIASAAGFQVVRDRSGSTVHAQRLLVSLTRERWQASQVVR
jgi:RimJ/RimL family protein N-acetyltransferase